MTPKQEAALRQAREALKLNCSSQTESPATKALAAIDEALAEQPAPPPPPECQTEAEKTAFAFGWWKALEMHRTPAQQEQEPAGAVYRYGKDSSGKPWHGIRWTASGLDLPDGTLIYTSPQPSKPLTDAQIGAVAADIWGSILIAPQSYQAFARAIEAAHGITGETK